MTETHTAETHAVAIPLPASRTELLARRKVKSAPALNDEVERIFAELLYENADYNRLVASTGRDDSVEGSVDIDQIEAARIMRDYARENHLTIVSNQSLTKLRHALRVVLGRYELKPNQRAA
jgi:hypothetical protein